MDTLPLPPRPNLDQYRKRAKTLVAAVHSGDPDAIRHWATTWLESLGALLDVVPSKFVRDSINRAVTRIVERVTANAGTRDKADRFALADAQLVMAREYDFPNWSALRKHLLSMTSSPSSDEDAGLD